MTKLFWSKRGIYKKMPASNKCLSPSAVEVKAPVTICGNTELVLFYGICAFCLANLWVVITELLELNETAQERQTQPMSVSFTRLQYELHIQPYLGEIHHLWRKAINNQYNLFVSKRCTVVYIWNSQWAAVALQPDVKMASAAKLHIDKVRWGHWTNKIKCL